MSYIFHVHTYRCKHASMEKEEEYIEKAIDLGSDSITFTDHAPFPGNPFGNRMDIEELPDYINTLKLLKEKYKNYISVRIGLEIEYFPSFMDYYVKLNEMKVFDILLLGQHMYEIEPNEYSFSLSKSELEICEPYGLCDAMIQGMNTHLFKTVAHPDRMFRKSNKWSLDFRFLTLKFMNEALNNGVVLEKNISSIKSIINYKREFWDLLPVGVNTIYGLDAHSVCQMEENYEYEQQIIGHDFNRIRCV